MTKYFLKVFSVITILALLLAGMPMQHVSAAGTISFTTLGSSYTENFDTLSNTAGSTTNNLTINGWYMTEVGGGARDNEQYAVDTGGSATGDTYSYGLAGNTERAFGGLQSGTLIPTIGASFTNNTGGTITSLAISYNGEQWRAGVTNRNAADRIDFQLSTDATGLTTGAWTDYDSLDFNSPNINTTAGALIGNSSGNRTIVNSTISCLNIPSGATFWIRWLDFNISGSDDGLAVDDFSLTPNGVVGDAAPFVCNTVPANGAVGVALNANITVNFSEPVNVSDTWYNITCTLSGPHTAVVTGGPTSFTLNPDSDFAYTESCTVTVLASLVTDQDAGDPPDTADADFSWSFTTASPPPPSPMIINEVDSDTPGSDTAEFVELYDSGLGNTDLSGLVVVFYNGNGDVSYAAFDLDTKATNASGYFVLGNSAVTSAPNIVFGNGLLQNGPDAVALYRGDATDFPNGSVVTVFNLIDALVYGSDAPDAGLLPLLNTGQPQIDEDNAGNVTGHSNQRCPNGSGGQRNTDTYLQNTPSAGVTNNCGIAATIMQIQDSAHRSPLNGQLVKDVPGLVTALRSSGFYMQDASGDGNPVTSDGIFVFTDSTPTVFVGDGVLVRGYVSEFRAGGSSSTNLTNTELDLPSITVISSGNTLPAPVVIGTSGRVPPSTVIEDDATGDVETSGVFDPASDGIDFYESLEGMRVQVNDAIASGPTVDFGSNREISVLSDNGANASVRTSRGGIVIQASDFNPERIVLNDLIAGGPTLPAVNVSDTFPGVTIGIMDYNFGNFKLEVTSLPAMVSGNLAQEVTTLAGTNQLAIATFNVENLDPGDGSFNTLAGLIVNNLESPDLLAIEEIQDNNGEAGGGGVDASTTWNTLITAIQSAGGPTYQYRQIDPVNGQDGGAPGGNIRQGFLFRTDRGLSFIDRPGGDSVTANAVTGTGAGIQLLYSPGRINPTSAAFNASRKPLAGEFLFNGHHLFVIANHFNSKGGDDPLYGHFQPPTRSSEVQRHQQAQIVHDFVAEIENADPDADVVVLGDLNDFQFSDTVSILKSGVLHTLMDTLPLNEQYSYDFDGNSQAIDHTLFSNHLFSARPFSYDVVHVNSEFANQASDHEPQVAQVTLNDPPTADAAGPYTVNEGGSILVTASGSDPENGPLTYDWDLDNNGSFETPGQSVTFSAPANSAPATYTIKVQVTDNGGLTAVDSATVIVIYNFNGFFQPVDNLLVLNVVKAGQGVPVKFSLAGDQGLAIFAPGSPVSQQVVCNSSDPVDVIEQTITAGSSSISYDPTTDTYTYIWKTDKNWANTCRQLTVTLIDGTIHIADFKFTK